MYRNLSIESIILVSRVNRLTYPAFQLGKDGAVIFETWEEVENTFGRLIPLDDYIANTAKLSE